MTAFAFARPSSTSLFCGHRPANLMDYYSFGQPYSPFDPAYEAEMERRAALAEYQRRRAVAEEDAARAEAYRWAQQQQQRQSWPSSGAFGSSTGYADPSVYGYDYDQDSAFALPLYGVDGRPRYTYGSSSDEDEAEPRRTEHRYRSTNVNPPQPRSRKPSSPTTSTSTARTVLQPDPLKSNNNNPRSRKSSEVNSPLDHSRHASPWASSRPASPTHVPQPQASTSSQSVNSKAVQNVAARRLQRFWRSRASVQKRFKQLDAIEQEYKDLLSSYKLPDSAVIDPKTGNLAFCTHNNPIHAYTDSLEKLQVKLDGVESDGNAKIRERRKANITTIEKELQRIEAWKNQQKERAKAHHNDEQQGQEQGRVNTESSLKPQAEKVEEVW